MTCSASHWLFAALLAGIISHLGKPALAGAEEETTAPAPASRVRLLLLGGAPEFGARVRGQLSDLDVLFEIAAPPNGAAAANVDAALAALAARHQADVVAWLSEAATAGGRDPVAARVHIWIAERAQVYSRRIASGSGASSPRSSVEANNHSGAVAAHPSIVDDDERSATLETAALFVRGAVRSVLLERDGVHTASSAAPALEAPSPVTPASSAAPSSREAAFADRERTEDAATSALPLAWAPRVGLDWARTGLSGVGAWSVDAALGLRIGRLSAGADLTLGFPELVRYQDLELSLRRETLVAEVGWEVLRLAPFSVHPSVQAGVARFTRSSRALATDRAATPDRTSLSALAAFELALECELGETLRLRGSGGIGWLSHVPSYVLEVPPGAQSAPLEAWRWMPTVGIALGAVF